MLRSSSRKISRKEKNCRSVTENKLQPSAWRGFFSRTINNTWTDRGAAVGQKYYLSLRWARRYDYLPIITPRSQGDAFFDKQNSRENSKTCVINRIMHGNRKRHKTDRNVREPGFRITDTLYMAHRGKALCTVLAWRGSTHIPCKCWRSLDLSLSPRDGGWLFVRFPASLRLACLSWPSSASLKMRCPGWFTPREGLSTQICASPYFNHFHTTLLSVFILKTVNIQEQRQASNFEHFNPSIPFKNNKISTFIWFRIALP